MKSVFFKNFLTSSIIVMLSFLILCGTVMSISYRTLADEQKAQLSRVAENISVSAASRMGDSGLVFSLQFNRELASMGAVTNTHIFVCRTDGSVIICSDPIGNDHVGATVQDAALKKLLATGSYAAFSALDGVLSDMELVVGHVVSDRQGNPAGAVFVSAPSYGEGAIIQAFYRIFVITAVLVFTIACMSSLVMSRRMTMPLRDMAVCAHRFAQGRFDVRVERWASREDETGELANAFNKMADSLEKAEALRRGFIANVSHELKTPMTTIAGYIDGILDGTVPKDREQETLTIVRDEVMRLSRLVRRMMDISRLETGEMDFTPTVFDACEHIRRILLGYESRIDAKKLEVEVDLPDTEVKVYADHDSIVQVVTNLLDNAVKFANEGGLLAVSLRSKGGKVTVSIKNTGAVIPSEDVPFVFERFYKADLSRSKDKAGLGLGLFICKSLLGAQGQSISVKSENDMTEFTFTLQPAK